MNQIKKSQPHVETNRNSPTTTPRWVKVFGIIVVVLILLFVILHLTGNSLGGHKSSLEHSVQ
jgi:hypothetical protein